jgi:hypothetical protein
VDTVLQLLFTHQLFIKWSECAFGVFEVEYLGHIVSHDGVHVDMKNIKSMKDWPCPKTIKSLRGFLRSLVIVESSSRTMAGLQLPSQCYLKNVFIWNVSIDQDL